MANSLSNLVNNPSEGIHKINVNTDMIKNVKVAELNINIATAFKEYTGFINDLIKYKCLCCNKNYQDKFDEKLKERFFNTYKFSNHDNNKFISFSLKDV